MPSLSGTSGAGVDDDDVYICGHSVDDLYRLGPVEVEREAALAPVQRHEGLGLFGDELQRESPGLAFYGFHLDYVGSHVGQHHPAERTGDDLA